MELDAATETRAAIRWLRWACVVVVLIYASMGLVVHEDAPLVAYGRGSNELDFVRQAADTLDRDAVWGDRPVVWLLGSSITRESFDVDAIREQLAAGGLDVGVEKYAFGRGAPLFSWMMLQRLDVRPGDHVVTTVAYDNFRDDWVNYHGNVSGLVLQLLTPETVVRIPGHSVADRLDAAVALLPPRSFWLHRADFREGLSDWVYYWVDPTIDKPPKVLEQHPLQPFQTKREIKNYASIERLAARNKMEDDAFVLAPGQVNWDALQMLVDDAEAAGATAWVVFVPHNPRYLQRGFISEAVDPRFQAAMREAYGDRYRALPQLPVSAFMDFRHPNYLGRPTTTRALASVLLERAD